MGLQTVLLHGHVASCVLGFALSLCLFVPILLHEAQFQGHCILFSNGSRNESGYLVVSWSSAFPCWYSLVVSAILLVVTGCQGYRLAKHLYYGYEGNFFSSFVDLVINTVLMLLVFTAAVVITLGFKSWCDTIISGYQTCAGASVKGIDKQDLEALSGFYLQMGTAQFGAWSSWVCCVALMVCALLQSCWHHQQENLKFSMSKERQRLLQESCQRNDSVNNPQWKEKPCRRLHSNTKRLKQHFWHHLLVLNRKVLKGVQLYISLVTEDAFINFWMRTSDTLQPVLPEMM